MNKKLIEAVAEQLGYEVDDKDFKRECEDICRSPYGAAAGFTGFIYYSETEEFFDKNKDLILDLAEEMADMCDYAGTTDMIKNFGCLRDDKLTDDEIAKVIWANRETDNSTQIKNAMSWFALEEVARYIAEE